MKRTIRRCVIAAAGAALAGSLAFPASALASPVVQPLDCESGAGHFLCDAFISGTTGTVHTVWTINGVAAPSFNDKSSVFLACTAGTIQNASVVVTDATGSSSAAGGVRCSSGPWP